MTSRNISRHSIQPSILITCAFSLRFILFFAITTLFFFTLSAFAFFHTALAGSDSDSSSGGDSSTGSRSSAQMQASVNNTVNELARLDDSPSYREGSWGVTYNPFTGNYSAGFYGTASSGDSPDGFPQNITEPPSPTQDPPQTQTQTQTPSASLDIERSPCTIELGQTACDVDIEWQFQYVSQPRIVKIVGADQVIIATSTQGNRQVAIAYGTTTFEARNGDSFLDRKQAQALCPDDAELTANDNGCHLTPEVQLRNISNLNLVRRGATANFRWTVRSSVPLQCSFTQQLEPFKTQNSPSQRVNEGSIASGPVMNRTNFTLSCSNDDYFPGRNFTDTVLIEVLPTVTEI